MDSNQGQNQGQPQTQEELDELRKQIELNENYQNEIKKDIEQQMPFISDVLDAQEVAAEYIGTKFEQSFNVLLMRKEDGGRGYSKIRRLRRDGNCFYRSFLFQMFEYFAINMQSALAGDEQQAVKKQYADMIKVIEASKQDLIDHAGYDAIVIEDFYDVFLEQLKMLEQLEEDFNKNKNAEGVTTYEKYVHDHLLKVLCNHEEANYIIMYMRFLAACYLKKNAILYEDFLGCDIATFCQREVEQVDVECDHPQIIAITNYLEFGVEINAVSQAAEPRIDVTRIPEDDFPNKPKTRVKVLFVPGHYDALYES